MLWKNSLNFFHKKVDSCSEKPYFYIINLNQNKMTAVEFMVEELNKSIGLTKFVDTCDDDYKQEILGIIEQAKEMEKQHLYNFYVQGGVDAIMEADRNVEQYYNETFKSE